MNDEKPSKLKTFSKYLRKIPLIIVIAIWVLLAFALFIGVVYLWTGQLVFSALDLGESTTLLDVIKVALTVVGGVAAVGYLVIKYQERNADKRAEAHKEKETLRDEKNQIEREMTNAINLLGSDIVSTRIAGVYSLTDIADTYKGHFKQRIVSILCGYLRSIRKNDSIVESTILNILREHYLVEPPDDPAEKEFRSLCMGFKTLDDSLRWTNCELDLRGAVFHEPIDFSYMVFNGFVNFDNAVFLNKAIFYGTLFKRPASFSNTRFIGHASFSHSHSFESIYFSKAIFFDTVLFYSTQLLKYCSFKDAAFYGDKFDFSLSINGDFIDFSDATFFCDTVFLRNQGALKFKNARFSNRSIHSIENSLLNQGYLFAPTPGDIQNKNEQLKGCLTQSNSNISW